MGEMMGEDHGARLAKTTPTCLTNDDWVPSVWAPKRVQVWPHEYLTFQRHIFGGGKHRRNNGETEGVREGSKRGLAKIESKQNTVTALSRFRFDRSGAPTQGCPPSRKGGQQVYQLMPLDG